MSVIGKLGGYPPLPTLLVCPLFPMALLFLLMVPARIVIASFLTFQVVATLLLALLFGLLRTILVLLLFLPTPRFPLMFFALPLLFVLPFFAPATLFVRKRSLFCEALHVGFMSHVTHHLCRRAPVPRQLL